MLAYTVDSRKCRHMLRKEICAPIVEFHKIKESNELKRKEK